MTTFRFRLETLLKLRRTALDQARAKLAEGYRADEILAGHLEETERQLRDNASLRRIAAGQGKVNVDAALNVQRYDMLVHAQRQALLTQRQKLAEAIELLRQQVIAADREVKVLEKLRERRAAEFAKAEAAREQKLFDEIAGRSSAKEAS
jgi:flagellar FliJ protein